MMRHISLWSVLAFAFVLAMPVQAEEDYVSTPPDNVQVENIVVQQVLDDVIVSFDIVNYGSDVQTDVHYAIALYNKGENQEEQTEHGERGSDHIVYHVSSQDAFALQSGQKLHKEIQFTVPEYIGGKYEAWIRLNTHSAFPIAERIAQQVLTFAIDGPSMEINENTCRVFIEGEEENYGLMDEVDVASEDKLRVACKVNSTYFNPMNVIPHFTTYYRSLYGDIVEERDNVRDITIVPGEEEVIFDIPLTGDPQAYDIGVDLRDFEGNLLSNAIYAHYVLQGKSATIQNVTFDKSSYDNGDIATIDLVWASSADQLNSDIQRGEGSQLEEAKALLVLTSDGKECAQEKEIELVEDQFTQTITLTNDCPNPSLAVEIMDGVEKLASGTFETGSEDGEEIMLVGENEEKKSTGIIFLWVFGVTIVLIVGIIVVRSIGGPRGGAKNPVKSLALMATIGGVLFVGGMNNAQAIDPEDVDNSYNNTYGCTLATESGDISVLMSSPYNNVPVNVPKGTYEVFLESWDGWEDRHIEQQNQNHERHHVNLVDTDGNLVASTGETRELPNDENPARWKGKVNGSGSYGSNPKIVVDTAVTQAHRAFPTHNSHRGCMVLRPDPDPIDGVCGTNHQKYTDGSDNWWTSAGTNFNGGTSCTEGNYVAGGLVNGQYTWICQKGNSLGSDAPCYGNEIVCTPPESDLERTATSLWRILDGQSTTAAWSNADATNGCVGTQRIKENGVLGSATNWTLLTTGSPSSPITWTPPSSPNERTYRYDYTCTNEGVASDGSTGFFECSTPKSMSVHKCGSGQVIEGGVCKNVGVCGSAATADTNAFLQGNMPTAVEELCGLDNTASPVITTNPFAAATPNWTWQCQHSSGNSTTASCSANLIPECGIIDGINDSNTYNTDYTKDKLPGDQLCASDEKPTNIIDDSAGELSWTCHGADETKVTPSSRKCFVRYACPTNKLQCDKDNQCLDIDALNGTAMLTKDGVSGSQTMSVNIVNGDDPTVCSSDDIDCTFDVKDTSFTDGKFKILGGQSSGTYDIDGGELSDYVKADNNKTLLTIDPVECKTPTNDGVSNDPADLVFTCLEAKCIGEGENATCEKKPKTNVSSIDECVRECTSIGECTSSTGTIKEVQP